MGRKAKIKKAKRQAVNQELSAPQSQPDEKLQPTQFVRQLESQGYALKKIERSPDLPSDRAEPQI